MPFVKETVYINAPPEKVYDVIADVENFWRFSNLIKSITASGAATYHWIVNVYGIELEWEAKVVENIKPTRFAWESISGVENSGAYILESTKDGTNVIFSMEYHLPNLILEKIAQVVTGGFMEKVASEILANVKKELEVS